jgi:hypothetical protein
MNWNFLYQITAASKNPWLGGYRPQIPVLCPLSSTGFVETPPPPRKNSWVRHWAVERENRKKTHEYILRQKCVHTATKSAVMHSNRRAQSG